MISVAATVIGNTNMAIVKATSSCASSTNASVITNVKNTMSAAIRGESCEIPVNNNSWLESPYSYDAGSSPNMVAPPYNPRHSPRGAAAVSNRLASACIGRAVPQSPQNLPVFCLPHCAHIHVAGISET